MGLDISKQRLYASLLILGAGILLFRTIMMLSQGALEELALWVSVLLLAELLIDFGCIFCSVRWWISEDKSYARLPLRLGAAAAILHAIRVLIYVLGRVGPWTDFDLHPAQRALHSGDWSWTWLYIAAVLSVLGVIGVLIIWAIQRRAKRKRDAFGKGAG
jgi:hypothetical protein